MPKKPREIVTGRALARRLGVSEGTIRIAFHDGRLVRIKQGRHKGKYDLSSPVNEAGMQIILENKRNRAHLKSQSKPAVNQQVTCDPPSDPGPVPKSKHRPRPRPKNHRQSIPVDNLSLNEIEDISGNPVTLLRILKEKEVIREKQLKNRRFRGELIDRALVAKVFNKLWSVDSSQLIPMPSKIAPEICSICGVEDSAIVIQVQEKLDKEIWRTLSHCKRLMNEFLSDLGAEIVEEKNEE